MQKLLQKLEELVGSDDFESESEEIIDQLQEAGAGDEIIPLLLQIMERHPLADFGMPGAMVHFMESFDPEYEEYLAESLKRRPAVHTVWMLNRCISVHAQKEPYLALLREVAARTDIEQAIRDSAQEFLKYQTG